MRKEKLTLARTLEIADQCEKVEAQMAGLSKDGNVHSIGKGDKPNHQQRGEQKKIKPKVKQHKDVCYRCGKAGHYSRDPSCPAKGNICKKCGGKDHFMVTCKSKPSEEQEQSSE